MHGHKNVPVVCKEEINFAFRVLYVAKCGWLYNGTERRAARKFMVSRYQLLDESSSTHPHA